MKKALIIGAGLGGLSTAITLVSKGVKVTVVEKNPQVGGKMNIYEEKGFRFDIGPHVITMPFIVDDLFSLAGKELSDYLTLQKVEPINRYFFEKNILDVFYSEEENLKNIKNLYTSDFEMYKKVSKLSETFYKKSSNQFLKYREQNLTAKMQEILNLFTLLFSNPFGNIENTLKKFYSKDLQDFYKLFGFYIGSDPKHTVNIYLMLQYLQQKFGVWYIKGGLYKLAESLQKIAEEKGVEFLFDSEVTKISSQENKISSVIINNKEISDFDYIISNADYSFTHSLIDSEKAEIEKENYAKNPLSPAAFILLLGLKNKVSKLSHHNTIMSRNLDEEYKNIFVNYKLSDDPTVGIDVASLDDNSIAPAGCENLFIMTNPSSSLKINWEEEKDSYADKIIKIIENRTGEKIKENIIVKKIITPTEFEKMYNQPFGAIYGPASWGIKGLFSRASTKSKLFSNLYFVGGSVQPGAGVPMVISSGMMMGKFV